MELHACNAEINACIVEVNYYIHLSLCSLLNESLVYELRCLRLLRLLLFSKRFDFDPEVQVFFAELFREKGTKCLASSCAKKIKLRYETLLCNRLRRE